MQSNPQLIIANTRGVHVKPTFSFTSIREEKSRFDVNPLVIIARRIVVTDYFNDVCVRNKN